MKERVTGTGSGDLRAFFRPSGSDKAVAMPLERRHDRREVGPRLAGVGDARAHEQAAVGAAEAGDLDLHGPARAVAAQRVVPVEAGLPAATRHHVVPEAPL